MTIWLLARGGKCLPAQENKITSLGIEVKFAKLSSKKTHNITGLQLEVASF